MKHTGVLRRMAGLALSLELVGAATLVATGVPAQASAPVSAAAQSGVVTPFVAETVVERRSSLVNTEITKQVMLTCENPVHVAYGPGVSIDGGNGQVSVVSLMNLAGGPLNRVVAVAAATGPGAGAWRLNVHAVCGTATGGMHIEVGQSSAFDSTAGKNSPPASCSNGRLLGIGGFITGGRLPGGQNRVLLTGLLPNEGLTAGQIFARELNNAYAGNWSVTAVALCATAALTGARPFSQVSSSVTGPSGTSVTPLCNAGAVQRRTHGVGAMVNGAAANNGHATVVAMQPSTFGAFASSAKTLANAESRTTTAFTICNQ